MMWTNTIVSSNESELYVEFTSPSGNKFTKRYPLPDDAQTFLSDKLNEIEILSATFSDLTEYKNVDMTDITDVTYKITYICMPADWIELFVDVTRTIEKEERTESKMFSVFNPVTVSQVLGIIKAKIEAQIAVEEVAE